MRNNIEINVQIMKHDKLPDILKLFEAILWQVRTLLWIAVPSVCLTFLSLRLRWEMDIYFLSVALQTIYTSFRLLFLASPLFAAVSVVCSPAVLGGAVHTVPPNASCFCGLGLTSLWFAVLLACAFSDIWPFCSGCNHEQRVLTQKNLLRSRSTSILVFGLIWKWSVWVIKREIVGLVPGFSWVVGEGWLQCWELLCSFPQAWLGHVPLFFHTL